MTWTPAVIAIVITTSTALGAAAQQVAPLPDTAARVEPLGLPIDCALGSTCFVQKYVDIDPTEGMVDNACGSLTSDGHQGTDFRILPGQSVDVLATAGGVVRAVREGMDDNPFDGPWSSPSDTACGNGVLIDHGGGLETLSCHMSPGSLRVAVGDEVEAGAVLGRVGASGQAAFRHVHLQVMVDGAVVDPFTGLIQGRAACGEAGEPLWRPDALEALTDTPRTAILAAGFSNGPVTIDGIEADRLPAALARDAEAIVAFGLVFGAEAGDLHHLTLSGPGIELDERLPQERAQAQSMRYAGRRMARGLTPGTYTMRYAIVRDDTVVDELEQQLTVD